MSTATQAVPAPETPREVPRIPGQFVLGSAKAFHANSLEFIRKAQALHGDVVHFKVAMFDWYSVAHPDDAYDITVTRAALFNKPKINKRIFREFLGNGVLSSDGDYWKAQHKLMQPAFHKQRIDAYGQVMVQYTQDLLDEWQQGESRDFRTDMTALTLRIVGKTLFNRDVKAGAKTVGDAMNDINEVLCAHINLPVPVPRWWPSAANRRKLKAIGDIEGIIRGIVAERRASEADEGDLMSTLVHGQYEDGTRMNDTQIRDEAMTLFFAGHETTAHALTWMWYILAHHPDVVEKVKDELGRVLQGRTPSVNDLPQLTYLDMVVKESMRLWPSVWTFMREPIEDVVVGGFRIPKGAQIMISPGLMQRDPRFFESPMEFRPERFTKENEKRLHRGAYMPFGAGPRICQGKAFALMEARLILACLLQRSVPRIPAGFVPTPVPQLSQYPKEGMPFVVEKTVL